MVVHLLLIHHPSSTYSSIHFPSTHPSFQSQELAFNKGDILLVDNAHYSHYLERHSHYLERHSHHLGSHHSHHLWSVHRLNHQGHKTASGIVDSNVFQQYVHLCFRHHHPHHHHLLHQHHHLFFLILRILLLFFVFHNIV